MKVDEKTAGVYVEITFTEGRIGGDRPEMPFTFKLNLRRALVLVKLDDPLSFDRKRVARSVPEAAAELTRLTSAKELAQRSLTGKAQLSPAAMHIALGGDAKASREVSHEDQLKIVQAIPETLVTPRPSGRRGYSWVVEPTFRPALRGQPWHPVDAPRMFVGGDRGRGMIEPQISVEIKCAFEDLEISDIVPKKESVSDQIISKIYGDSNKAAAAQYLKFLLIEANLHPAELDNRFREVLLASVVALES